MRGSYVLGLFVVLAGCNGTQRYIGSETGGLFELAMTETTPAFLESEDGNIFIIEQTIPIPFREPTPEELAMMANPGVDTTPFGSMPFIRRHDIEVQIDWTLSNVDPVENAPSQATVIVNGINEFNEYVPGVRVVDDELII